MFYSYIETIRGPMFPAMTVDPTAGRAVIARPQKAAQVGL